MTQIPGHGPAPEPTLVTIGDIVVTQSWVVTPSGTAPVGGVHWSYTDMSRTTQAIPIWAIICAAVGFLLVCVFSLFFLLAKETRTEGWVQVTVQGPGLVHSVHVPVFSPNHVFDTISRVNHARSISATAGGR